jgi:hypothetical protein
LIGEGYASCAARWSASSNLALSHLPERLPSKASMLSLRREFRSPSRSICQRQTPELETSAHVALRSACIVYRRMFPPLSEERRPCTACGLRSVRRRTGCAIIGSIRSSTPLLTLFPATSAYMNCMPKTCPDCGGTQSRSRTGLAKDARCVQCDGPMNGQTVFYKYLGALILLVVLVLAGAWIVLAGSPA